MVRSLGILTLAQIRVVSAARAFKMRFVLSVSSRLVTLSLVWGTGYLSAGGDAGANTEERYVAAVASGQPPTWTILGNYPTLKECTDAVKGQEKGGTKCFVLRVETSAKEFDGSSPIMEGTGYLKVSEFEYRDGQLNKPTPNVYYSAIATVVKRIVDPKAPKTNAERLSEVKAKRVDESLKRMRTKPPFRIRSPGGRPEAPSGDDILKTVIDVIGTVLPIILGS
jgi:hypothetical protein